jgi:hypothetical protein
MNLRHAMTDLTPAESPTREVVGAALQINMHPLDLRHLVHTLEHQLAAWGGQVERIVLTVDTRQSRSGRYKNAQYEENVRPLFAYLEALAGRLPKIEIVEIDYSPRARAAVKDAYFREAEHYPEKAFDGGPFHAYFYGLYVARAHYIVHMDSDMLFGGMSQTWLKEAVTWFEKTPNVLFAGPLPGPPRADGVLGGVHQSTGVPEILAPRRLDVEYPAYLFKSVSTRIFVFDQRRFDRVVKSFRLVRPELPHRMRARAFGQSPLSRAAEEVMTAELLRRDLYRLDFLGSQPGMYSLHPPYRSEEFYRRLPEIIARVASGAIPEGQRGEYELNSSMIDWSDALRAKTVSRRLARAAKHFFDR